MVASTIVSAFADVKLSPPIEVFNVNKAFLDDQDPKKVNLSIGAYRDDNGKPWILPVVRNVEKALSADDSQTHEYLPILGFEPFCKAATELLLGENHVALVENRAFGIQSLSGTGSLRIGIDLLFKVLNYKTALISSPSWGNHQLIFRQAGFQDIRDYRYWNNAERCVDFEGFLSDMESAPERSIVILHGCAHNPTGMDLTKEQWIQLCTVIRKKKIFPFFDIAYQGFASGNPDDDAWSVRYFAEQGIEMLVAQSFAKNFGLYNERVGNLVVVVNEPNVIAPLKSQLTTIVRGNYSNPPAHGAKIVHKILTDKQLKQLWKGHIVEMSDRIKLMRQMLRERLEALKTPGKWSHITEQIGMFSYTGLTEKQVQMLTKDFHIYLLKSGRISVAGLNKKNLDYVAVAINEVVVACQN